MLRSIKTVTSKLNRITTYIPYHRPPAQATRVILIHLKIFCAFSYHLGSIFSVNAFAVAGEAHSIRLNTFSLAVCFEYLFSITNEYTNMRCICRKIPSTFSWSSLSDDAMLNINTLFQQNTLKNISSPPPSRTRSVIVS